MQNDAIARGGEQEHASLRRAAAICVAFGLVLVACAALWAWMTLSSTRGMIGTQGTVVGFLNDSRDPRFFRPVFSFLTQDGERVVVRGRTASAPPAYELGEKVALYYRAGQPSQDYVIDNLSERWFPVVVLSVLGIAFAGAGAITRVLTQGTRGNFAGAVKMRGSVAQRRRALHRRDLMICAAPIAMGAVALAIACGLFIHERHITGTFIHTTGQVVDMVEPQRRVKGGHLASAVVRFKTASGQVVTFVQGSSSTGNTLAFSDTVGVLYDPDNPQRAIVDRFGDRWGAAAILCAIGLPMMAIGFYFLFGMLAPARSRKR
ncbi:DUF3592 domain-containing protein [Paraburkholderia oxyphila]|uniref:DUF3592 domain-containing protein n=1 Tax=Paraburkholderia oxyphila TaxID=614212 RepID=UPI000484F5C4|nr:DUF3592 domain-containing protein [Paraburkholderia oxyphila]